MVLALAKESCITIRLGNTYLVKNDNNEEFWKQLASEIEALLENSQ